MKNDGHGIMEHGEDGLRASVNDHNLPFTPSGMFDYRAPGYVSLI